ncbi:MAG: hypothetical protein ACYS8Y_12605, partial [Planctomycetota bacterium]
FKIWYPYLSDTFDMVLSEQLEWIEDLEYAGIQNWRIAYFWDAIPLKCSLFENSLVLGGINNVSGFDTSAYFPYTSEGQHPATGAPIYNTHGRTGDEDGLVTGAIINARGMIFAGLPQSPHYMAFGTPVPGRTQHYTLPRGTYLNGEIRGSEAQDHWICLDASTGSCIYNDDLNYTPEDLPYAIQGGNNPCGAWTLSETMPQLWPPNHKFHSITISDVNHTVGINPYSGEVGIVGVLIPVEIVSVMQDEQVINEGSGNTAPDAIIDETETAAVVQVRAERDGSGNGRVYHIYFYGEGNVDLHTLTIGVPNNQGKKTILVDDGPLYDSTAIAAP